MDLNGQFWSVLTVQSFINVLWASTKSCAYQFWIFNLKIVQLFTKQWKCCIDNLTSLLFSRKKVIATQWLAATQLFATGSYTIFQRENTFSPFSEHRRCTVFIGTLLSTHLLFKGSQPEQMNDRLVWLEATRGTRKANELCSWLLICFRQLICIIKTKGHYSGNFPLIKTKS